MSLKSWELISSQVERSFRIFNLRLDRARSPRTNEVHDFYVMETSPWVNVIPITHDNRVVLIRQYRHGIRQITLEIPGGVVEPTDTPEEAAIRELQEETGYRPGEIVSLGWSYPNPAIHNNRCYTYLAKNVMPAGIQKQDACEDIEVVFYPASDIEELIRCGEISHALIIAAFHRYFLTLKQ